MFRLKHVVLLSLPNFISTNRRFSATNKTVLQIRKIRNLRVLGTRLQFVMAVTQRGYNLN
jgi:hypothetical protein